MESQLRKSVLVIDDDSTQRTLLNRILALHGLSAVLVDSGAAAVEWLSQNSLPDLIIVDMLMPGMTGIETAERIHELHGQKTPPIVGLTGQTQAGGVHPLLRDYILKPFEISELIDRLRPFLDIDE